MNGPQHEDLEYQKETKGNYTNYSYKYTLINCIQ